MPISSLNPPMRGKGRGRLFRLSIRFVILFHGSDISKALHIEEPDTIILVGECWKLSAGNTIIEADFASVSETFVFSYSVLLYVVPDSKVHGANMGPTWVLSAPDRPHVGPMNHAIRGDLYTGWDIFSRLRAWSSHGLTQFVRYAMFYEQTPCEKWSWHLPLSCTF